MKIKKYEKLKSEIYLFKRLKNKVRNNKKIQLIKKINNIFFRFFHFGRKPSKNDPEADFVDGVILGFHFMLPLIIYGVLGENIISAIFALGLFFM